MVGQLIRRAALAGLLAALAVPASAQTGGMISASRVDELIAAMKEAGYKAELHTDEDDGPHIDTALSGWDTSIYLYNCDEGTGANCQSLLLRAGFDRKKPMPLEMVNEIMSTERFMAIYLDKDGDPWADWDIYTGEGIPKAVFFAALERYSGQIDWLSEKVFEEENADEADEPAAD